MALKRKTFARHKEAHMRRGLQTALVALALILVATTAWAGGSKEGAGQQQSGEQQQQQSSAESDSGRTEIRFWHAFSDEPRSNWIEERAAEYNEMQSEFEVEVSQKGSYRETLQSTILAARQGEPPHAAQIFEIGSQLALDSGVFEPIGQIGDFETSDYIDPVMN
jgi:ABC-type glycerol-3-phosphate transport system substrate-binding protein